MSAGAAPLLDLPRLLVTIRRGKRRIAAFALLGLLVGVLVTVLVPPKPTAVTRLLIVHEDDQPSDVGTLIRTDVALLETTRIAEAALDELGVSEPPKDFLTDYQAVGLTSNVLELTVTGDSDADAVARAKALGEVFIADHVRRVQAAADAEAAALLDQRDRAKAELAEVDATIARTSDGQRGRTAAQLESLYARRAELTSTISDLSRQAEEAGIGAPRVAAGTSIVDEPRALPRSVLRSAAVNGAVGLALALAVGLAWTLAAGVVRDRPVLRRDIAEHLGASVIAQLPTRRRWQLTWWRRWRGDAPLRRAAATLARLARPEGNPPETVPALSMLALGCTPVAAALASEIAGVLAGSARVVLVDDLPGQPLLTGRDADAQPTFQVISGADDVPRWPGFLRLGVGSVEPGAAWTDLPALGAETVLVVRAGYARTAWLHTVARQLADERIPVVGVVLVDPDPRDASDGTLWDALRTALRGRSGVATAPQNGARPAPRLTADAEVR